MSSDLVHLHWLRVPSTTPEHIAKWRGFLDQEENIRAERFRCDSDRAAYVTAHALLRSMLCSVTGETAMWEFRTQRYGKPELAPKHNRPNLHFNITHTSDFVACAVAPFPVGVDIETLERSTDFLVSERFSASERARLASAAAHEKPLTFFRIWTLKEAFLKATGDGLTRSLASFAFDLNPPRISFAPPQSEDAESWRFFEFMPAHGRPLALAVRSGDRIRVSVLAGPVTPTQIGAVFA